MIRQTLRPTGGPDANKGALCDRPTETPVTRNFQVVGADPGKRELLVCVNADTLSSVRYTAAQRRCEMHMAQHAEKQRETTPEELQASITSLSRFQLAFILRPRQSDYLRDVVRFYFGHGPLQRKMAPTAAVGAASVVSEASRTLSHDCTMQTDPNVPMVLAYGSWGGVAGTPGAPCNKGHPSCLGKGLRHKLSRHFVVLTTPEAYTSKTCSICGSTCGPCHEVDDAHRVARLEKATTDEERRRAARFSVRGLRHCHNVECAAHLNRDHNAAVNIQRRCECLVANGALVPMGDCVDQKLEALDGWMHHSD